MRRCLRLRPRFAACAQARSLTRAAGTADCIVAEAASLRRWKGRSLLRAHTRPRMFDRGRLGRLSPPASWQCNVAQARKRQMASIGGPAFGSVNTTGNHRINVVSDRRSSTERQILTGGSSPVARYETFGAGHIRTDRSAIRLLRASIASCEHACQMTIESR